MDGIARGLEPPAAVDNPYDPGSRVLPANILEAIAELRQSTLFRRQLGDSFVDYLLTIKDFEVRRFLSEEVTDWEHREYFELL
jgi:glutamine synthetase